MSEYDAGNRKSIRAAEKSAKLISRANLETIVGIMSVMAGRAWMHDFLSQCNVFHTPWVGDDAATNFNCGVQSVGLRMLNDIMLYAPENFTVMMREANERPGIVKTKKDEEEDSAVEEKEVGTNEERDGYNLV